MGVACATRDEGGSATAGIRALSGGRGRAKKSRGIIREGAKEMGEDSVARRGDPEQAAPSPLVLIQLGAALGFKGKPGGSQPFPVSL